MVEVFSKATNTLSNQQVGMQNILSKLTGGNNGGGDSAPPVLVTTNTVMSNQTNSYHTPNLSARDFNGIQYKLRNSHS